jgi:ATP-binding cassette subfamily C protein CydD
MSRSVRRDRTARSSAKNRIFKPIARELRISGLLAVLAGCFWPVQAGAIAWAASEWVQGDPALRVALIAGGVFVTCALCRALLDSRAGALLFEASDRTTSRERARLISQMTRSPSSGNSAELAALVVQKLPLLQPWITRYPVARARTFVLPPLLFLLAFSQSWVVGLTLLFAGPLIPVFMALIGMAAEDASRRQLKAIGTMNGMLIDRLSAILDIRLIGAGDRNSEAFRLSAETVRAKTLSVLRVAFLSSTVLELFSALGVAMVAVFVGFTLLGEIGFGDWGTGLTIGQGVFLLLIAPEFFQPLRELAAAWHDRASGLAVAEALEAHDRTDPIPFLGHGVSTEPLAGPMRVVLSNVRVMLSGRLISLPNITIEQGRGVAIAGPSGVGKSTTLSAIAGLYPFASGGITVCGHPLADETADAWRQRLAFVPQQPHFSKETLLDWLTMGRPGKDPWEVLHIVQAAEVVRKLPAGLRTRLGETGGGVSGGEARRLLLARAILTGADLILADEPTADLDADTAETVVSALIRVRESGRALVVATHDPKLAAAMDVTVAMGP